MDVTPVRPASDRFDNSKPVEGLKVVESPVSLVVVRCSAGVGGGELGTGVGQMGCCGPGEKRVVVESVSLASSSGHVSLDLDYRPRNQLDTPFCRGESAPPSGPPCRLLDLLLPSPLPPLARTRSRRVPQPSLPGPPLHAKSCCADPQTALPDLPNTSLSFIISPKLGFGYLKELYADPAKKPHSVWLQPGAESDEIEAFIKEHNLSEEIVVGGPCVLVHGDEAREFASKL